MAFQPGPVAMAAVSPTSILNKTLSGFGQAIVGGVVPALQSNFSQSTLVNIGVNAGIGAAVNLASSVDLFSAVGLSSSALTSLVPSLLSGDVNNILAQTITNAGGVSALVDNIFNKTTAVASSETGDMWGKLEFPGAGTDGEAKANFGNSETASNYSLGTGGADVTFTLTRANRGPQEYGSATASNTPTTGNTVGTDQYTGKVPNAASPAANAAVNAKTSSMTNASSGAIGKTPFTSSGDAKLDSWAPNAPVTAPINNNLRSSDRISDDPLLQSWAPSK
jgi:hypothetical protein